jgi:hypothetical protein
MEDISTYRIFNEKHLIEDSCLKLWYGFHANERINERGKGSLCVKPSIIKITKENVVGGYLENGKLQKFIYKLSYNNKEDLYLVVTESFFIKGDYFVKSLWFRNKNNNGNNIHTYRNRSLSIRA